MKEIKIRYFFEDSLGEKHILTEDIEEIEGHLDIPKNIEHGWKLLARAEYTGLKDKKGVEVYEGDFLKPVAKIYRSEILRVEWYKPLAQFHGVSKTDEYSLWDDLVMRCKVIGNIYKNPELLEDPHIHSTSS